MTTLRVEPKLLAKMVEFYLNEKYFKEPVTVSEVRVDNISLTDDYLIHYIEKIIARPKATE